ncbi:MAG: J domain-containing protein [Acidobacteria bacterium]|nr:J domain-containing protein [Acidobacteriota bacterium]
MLGVQRRATPEEIRRAYHDLARVLHPDRLEGRMGPERVGAERRMQEINEAWRILRDPGSRAAYDQSLGMRAAKPPRPQATPSARDDDDDLDFDTPFQGKPAEPGDLTVSVARALPWLVIAVVLGAIFIFTAFARHSTSEAPKPSSLIGQCITSSGGGMVAVPCAGPNDGKVIDVEPEASACPSGSSARSVSAKEWMCLEPVAQGATGTTSP